MTYLDTAAEQAMSEHQKFRGKHWQYFKTHFVFSPSTNQLIPAPVNKHLEAESIRLFFAAAEANRKATK